jgi:hypothetical protein
MRKLLPLFLFMMLTCTMVTAANLEVTFHNGNSIAISSITYQGSKAMLTLQGGGLLGVESSRIRSVRDTSPAVPEQPAPTAGETLMVQAASAGTPDPAGQDSSKLTQIPPVAVSAVRGSSPREKIETMIVEASLRHGIDPILLRSLIAVESAFDARAVSPKGAKGLAQLMPATARDLGVENPFDPEQAVDAAARHLKILLAESGGGFVGALAAYNAGQGAVRRYGGLPPYSETIDYVEKVLKLYAKEY